MLCPAQEQPQNELVIRIQPNEAIYYKARNHGLMPAVSRCELPGHPVSWQRNYLNPKAQSPTAADAGKDAWLDPAGSV